MKAIKYILIFLISFSYSQSNEIDDIKQETQEVNTKTFNLLELQNSQIDSLKLENSKLQSQLNDCGNSGSCLNGITSFPYNESFENTFSNWMQSTNDDLDWSLKTGRTPSNNTGASSAIDGSYYIYVEASGSNNPSKRAILTSPCFDMSGIAEPIFSFKYHQFGNSNMGSVDVEISTDNGANWSSIWQSTGNLGDSWQTAEINVSQYLNEGVQFRLNRVTGSTWQSDVCIDDIRLGDKEAVEPNEPVKAFPTAYGAGANVTGGRGGVVVHVTNLNNSGVGSLREALLMTVPRTIVFDVSGRINLTSIISLTGASSNFTIAGQTAPEGGITISGKPIKLGEAGTPCNNVIIRHIRFRNGSYTGQANVYNHNGLMSDGSKQVVIDHCSFSFCDDQAISMDSHFGDLTDITIQRCLFSENATQIILGLGGANDRGNISVINNLFVDVTHRTPNMGGNLQWDIINNVYFNWGNRCANANNASPKINHISNYYREGAYSNTVRTNVVQSTPIIYTANNYHSEIYKTPQLDDRGMWTDFWTQGQALPSSRFTTTQYPLLGKKPIIKTAFEAYTEVTSDVGSNKYLKSDGSYGIYQDSFDTTKISNVLNNVSSNPANKSWTQPILPLNTRSSNYDTDGNGIPNNLEYLLPSGKSASDLHESGYSYLEWIYLNNVDK